MRESPRSFERRTGRRYEPPPALLRGGRRLGVSEACPTLFRYPGPEGIMAELRGGLHQLAPPGVERVWLASRPTAERARAARLFGTLAVLQPLHISPAAARRRGVYLAPNGPVPPEAQVVWVPPSQVAARVAWDRLRTAEDAQRRFGHAYADERSRALDGLSAYLEEIAELERASGGPLDGTWLGRPRRERRALLDRLGVHPRWTGA